MLKNISIAICAISALTSIACFATRDWAFLGSAFIFVAIFTGLVAGFEMERETSEQNVQY